MKFTNKQFLYGAGLLLTGLFLGWLIFSSSTDHEASDQLSPEEMEQHVQDSHTDEDGETIWTCSMHPQVRESEPGNCPICGMELIPADSQEGEAEEDDYSMVMTASAAKLADIQTAPVIRETPQIELELPGRIRVDERRITRVTTHFPGRIRDLKVDFTGASISKGEPMATIYSPDLISAQRELLEAAKQKERNPRLYESVRQKFRLWEFTDEQIQAIEERGTVQDELEILSPADGYVLSQNVAEEQHVSEGTVIYEVANLEQVWVVLEAYEDDIQWIKTGDNLTFRSRNNPSKQYEATVNWIDPVVDPSERTVGVRADLANPGNQLKPDMLVRGTLLSNLESEKLMVPASSVLWTGPRSLVYVKDTSVEVPRFEVREVELGVRSGDYYVIEEGLDEGEEVVFNGNFRIDSEFQLADKFSMMNRDPGSGAVPTGHQHGDTDMDESEMEEEDHSDHQSDGSAEEEGNEVDEAFREEFTEMLEIYLTLKNELIESDLESAVNSVDNLVTQLEEIGEHRLEGDSHVAWMESYSAIMEHAESMSNTDDIEEYREAFSLLSDQLIEDVKSFGIEGVVYHQYCPMAFDNEGADWLSRNEQIQNPYLPENMLTCGEVIERIEK
jgi:Cu(I)/Ag(I) efflux system membrane fusion protein